VICSATGAKRCLSKIQHILRSESTQLPLSPINAFIASCIIPNTGTACVKKAICNRIWRTSISAMEWVSRRDRISHIHNEYGFVKIFKADLILRLSERTAFLIFGSLYPHSYNLLANINNLWSSKPFIFFENFGLKSNMDIKNPIN